MKSWYFLDDCNSDNGPFTYLPGSQRLTLARLKWEYKKSITISQKGDHYSSNGSFRATPEDLISMGMGKPIGMPPNAACEPRFGASVAATRLIRSQVSIYRH